jgi:septal ring factor EnvC (AmiA/AmiB activator)
MTLKEAKESLSYYYISKFNEDVERHLQFFLTLKKIAMPESEVELECKAAECSSPFVDPIEAELEQARLEYEEKVRYIKEKPTRQAELLQEQEVLKQEMKELFSKVEDFKVRWNKWFREDDARLTI